MDGAQLYAHKASDCWIYIWVIMDLSPDERYKKRHVIPGGFIPGPNKPKNIDSFLFPGLHHLSALQREGLSIWDAYENRYFVCNLYIGLNTAGSISLNWYINNLQHLLSSPNDTQYKKRRLETGITKPTIFLGVPNNRILGIPGCFGSDIMHLGTFNLSDLLLSLWRGQLDCERTDSISSWPWAILRGAIWEQHGKDVAECTPYLPGSFDRPPRNIAEKINSGYKAWEWLLYLYGLAPALLFDILPQPYYSHFCKLVQGMRIIQQHHIKTADLVIAGDLLKSFTHEFETLYYQRRVDRLHFCRQSIHALLHLASEVTRIGPPICSSQWTMERTIGNLGEEIRQPSNPYANLSQRGLLRCQVNALTAMIPDLQKNVSILPRGAIDIGKGYALLRA